MHSNDVNLINTFAPITFSPSPRVIVVNPEQSLTGERHPVKKFKKDQEFPIFPSFCDEKGWHHHGVDVSGLDLLTKIASNPMNLGPVGRREIDILLLH